MRIPSDKIDDVRNATDIIDYIGAFVKLKKRGSNYIGLCPFHQEKTPSFNVSSDRQMYHCFGCGVGGTVFTFIMERDKVSFVEAVRLLAERAGIALPTGTAEQDSVSSEQEQMYELLRVAGLFYYNALTETAEGKFSLDYFHKRGFTDETIRSFGLGYSPNSWDAFIKHAQAAGYTDELLVRAGLARKREEGGTYDYFRGRAMFPIFSSAGRIIGFGARKLREDDPLGKYINSPETPVYNKSRVLYGASQAKEAIREAGHAVLVEGYADLISVFQSGVKNIVASSGTALTTEQIQLIKRYASTIIVVYDADSAGSKAAMRGVDLILQHDMEVRVAALPDGDDPDSFVRTKGIDAFKKLVASSQSFVDFLAQTYERQGMLATPEGQANAVRSIVRMIANISDGLKRDFYVKEVADKYKLYESTLHRELEKMLAGDRRRSRDYPEDRPQETQDSSLTSGKVSATLPAAERDIVHAIFDGGPDVVAFVREHLRPDDFTHPHTRSLITFLFDRVDAGESIEPGVITNELDDESLRQLVADVVFDKYSLSKRWHESDQHADRAEPMTLALDALRSMARSSLERLKDENQELLREASRKGEDVMPYLERDRQLLEDKKALDGHQGSVA